MRDLMRSYIDDPIAEQGSPSSRVASDTASHVAFPVDRRITPTALRYSELYIDGSSRLHAFLIIYHWSVGEININVW